MPSRLHFYRRRTWRDAVRRYRIEIDGQVVGRLKPRGTLTVDIAPGTHQIVARIDWTGSPPAEVDVAANEQVELYAGPAKGLPLHNVLSSDGWLVVAVTGRSTLDGDSPGAT